MTTAATSTTEHYDLVVIGSGPAAIAALDGLSPSLRTAVVTGATGQARSGAWLHPKIRAVAAERGEGAGLADAVASGRRGTKPLWATATIGGLANYWGQQFLPVGAADPWPADIFRDHPDYVAEVEAVEALFTLQGGEALDAGLPDPGFRLSQPRLLTGSAHQPDAGLLAMRAAFATAVARRRSDIVSGRADSIAPHREGWAVKLTDGSLVTGKRLLLAAGVVGDAQLLLRSFADLDAASFADHMPWMLYASGLKRLFDARLDTGPGHFNALTIEQHEGARSSAFASVYDMSQAGLNLLTAALIGRCFPMLRGRGAPPSASLVTPIQLWTTQSIARIALDGSRARFAVLPDKAVRPGKDPALAEIAALLRAVGGRVLRTSRTAPGLGFHYHDLRLRLSCGAWQGVADFLKARTGPAVTCVDSAILDRIGCRPPTLTAMASARRLAAQLPVGAADDQCAGSEHARQRTRPCQAIWSSALHQSAPTACR